MVKTNELKKGARVQLRPNGFSGPVGWFATITDNQKGTIRQAEVEGLYKEIGSVYAHDIMRAQVNGVWVDVAHTDAQLKCRKMNAGLFG